MPVVCPKEFADPVTKLPIKLFSVMSLVCVFTWQVEFCNNNLTELQRVRSCFGVWLTGSF